jgi:hypothetical protein
MENQTYERAETCSQKYVRDGHFNETSEKSLSRHGESAAADSV